MKRKWTTASFILSGLLLTAPAYAIPFASNKCSAQKSKIKHPTNAQGVVFDEECTTAYVLPPELGKAWVSSLSKTSNLNFCPSVNKIPTISKRMVDSLDVVAGKIEKMIKDFEPMEKGLQDLRAQNDQLQAEYDLQKDIHQNHEDELEVLKEALTSAVEEYNDCKTLRDESECKAEKRASELAKQSWAGYRTGEFRISQKALNEKKSASDRSKRALARATSELASHLEPVYALQERLFTLRDQLSSLYNEYAPMRAVTGQLVYSVAWTDLINEYQNLNPNSPVNFTNIPVTDARIYATAHVDRQNGNAGIPVLLHAAIAGLPEMGVETIGQGNLEVQPDHEAPQPLESNRLGIGNASVSGQITLSAVGACSFFPQGLETPREEIASDELTANLVVNAIYEFPMKARRKYVAEYKLSQMMERIEKKKTKNGFFSSRSVHEVIENSNSSDWFKIKFDANDPEFSYSSEEQNAISNEVKIGLVQRALSHVAATTFSSGGVPPQLPSVPPTGASVTSNILIKQCGFWIYCRAGGFILQALNSIFGSSEAVSKFKRSNSSWVREDVEQVAVMRRHTGLTFVAK